ncbi:MAG: hypothetical protein LBH82_05395 [Bacteroidales bacterium]|nr:hypothetical protein [Bacteroidales bacterium]
MKTKPLRFQKPQRFKPIRTKETSRLSGGQHFHNRRSSTYGKGHANQPLPGGQDKNSE